MKRYLLLLVTLVSVSVYGQIQKQVTFDFTQPSSLNPIITPPDPNLTVSVEVTEKIFKSGEISISFARGSVYGGAQYKVTTSTNGVNNYYLEVNRSTTMTFASNDDAAITSIEISDDSTIGDFSLVSGQPGYQDPDRMYKYWTCNDNNNVHSVAFMVGGEATKIKKVTVHYTEPVNVLSPLSTNIPTTKVASFNGLELTFASAMTEASAASVYAASEDGKQYQLSCICSGSTVTLSPEKPISKDGKYTITIPEGRFRDYEGYCNRRLEYNVTVEAPKDVLNYVSVSPEEGEIDKLSSGIVLMYDKPITVVSNPRMILKKDGVDYTLVNIIRSSGNSKCAELTFDIPEGITEKGFYTIDIPENVVSDQLGNTHNPAFTLTYKVGYTPEPPAPVDSEIMKAAKALLQKSGVGYPAADSDARMALATLTTAVDTPDDEALKVAMEDFYNETNVEMPVSGVYYKIANVNSENKKLYFTYTDGGLTLSSDATEAASFKAMADGAISFQTSDGKYLNVAGISDDETVKDLTMRKFKISSAEASAQLGCFSINGNVKNAAGIVLTAYALVNHEESKVVTDATVTDLFFTSSLSNAFILTETVKPGDDPVAIDMACSLSPSVLKEKTGVITLTFQDGTDVVVVDAAKAYLANEDKNPIVSLSLVKSDDNTNELKIAVSQLEDGKYFVMLPEGSVSYVVGEQTYINKLLSLAFTVETGGGGTTGGGQSGDNENFKHEYNYYTYYPLIRDYIKDVDLNTFSIADIGYEGGFHVDENRTVRLVQIDTARKIAEGHFRQIPEFPGNPELKNVYQIVWDSPITEGSLKADTYTIILDPATVGDNNFAKYVSGTGSVIASECNVNYEVRFAYWVNNDLASGIKEIGNTENNDSKQLIYDLTGRRVASMDKPGVYIVNGRKVVRR